MLLVPWVSDPNDGLLSAAVGPAVALLLLVAIPLAGASDPAVLGTGSTEYSRLLRGFAGAAIGLALLGLAAGSTACGPGCSGSSRWPACSLRRADLLCVKPSDRRRAAGKCTQHVLAVGSADVVADLISRTRRDPRNGWTITGACTPTGTGLDGAAAICGVPVVGDLDAVAKVARLKQHHVVSVFATAGWSSARLHRLAWDVEEVGVELVVDPRLTEVAGPRLRVEPMDGLPLLRLTHPALTDVSTLVKALIDRIGAAMLLLVLAPLLLGLAVGIRLGGGQVLRRQTHVGRSGRRFALLRFRSTRTDPARRATKLDGWIRRNGLDELPQLFNVLSGSMSLIGPRPARPDEVARYPAEIRAAAIVRPGLTGLWQSSGSEALSLEEDIRLDARYLEHWSLMEDAAIAWQSVKAAAQSGVDY